MKKTSNGGHLKESRGFTLIELLVVIAIIGLLAAVVLASIGSARQKGGDAAVQSNLDGIRSQAELFASGNSNSYEGTCLNATVVKAIAAASTASGTTVVTGDTALSSATSAVCHDLTTGWAVSVPLLSDTNQSWCVDGYGNATSTASATALGDSSITCGA